MTVQIDENLAPPWILDGPHHPLSRLSADEIRTARRDNDRGRSCGPDYPISDLRP